jgi:cytochrome c556
VNMRTVQWLFVIGVALFISGIAFIVAGARTARAATPSSAAQEAVQLKPVASVKQIMAGITGPAATVVYDAVSTVITTQGVTETAPKNDEEWAHVGNNAAALAESGNLLMMSGRAIDNGDWIKLSGDLITAADSAVKAADAQSKEGIIAAGGAINETCDSCHEKYQRGQ